LKGRVSVKKIKFIHCADIHLDAPFSSMTASGGKTSLRRYDLKEVFRYIIEIAQNNQVSLLLISGDLYEHNYVKKSTIDYINSLFKQIGNIHVFIAPGNHDPYSSNSYYNCYKWNDNVHILTQDNPSYYIEELGVYIHGTCFNSFIEEKSLLSHIKPVNKEYINILLAHGTAGMQFDNCQYNPMSIEELSSLGMDYIALGHFHNRFEVVKENIFNPGSPEPLGFDEIGEHGIYLCSIANDGTPNRSLEYEFIKTNKRSYIDIDVFLDGCSSNEEAAGAVNKQISAMDRPENLLVNINLKGRIAKDLKLDLTYLKQLIEDKLFYVRLQDNTSKDIDLDEAVKDPGIKGLFVKKLLDRINSASDEKERKLLLDSLYYGLEALDNGKVEIVE